MITLGIIGVVAAMTMPSLIADHQKKVTVTKLKKIYSILSQVQQKINYDAGYSNWDVYDEENIDNAIEAFNKYMKPYLNVTEVCKPQDSCFDGYYKVLSGAKVSLKSGNYFIQANLQDGTLLYLRYIKTGYFNLFVDINGYKRPNILGKDVFELDLTKNGVLPAACGNCTREEAINNFYGCRRGGHGATCFQLILLDDWQIKEDYPW